MATIEPRDKYSWMKVVDVMTKNLLTVTPSETIGLADELMSEHRIRQIPVAEGKELVGIVTDRDIRSFLGGSVPESPEAKQRAFSTPVGEIMTAAPFSLSPDDDLQDAVELLIEEKIGGIPVVDETEGLVGIVTYVDVLRCFLNRLQED